MHLFTPDLFRNFGIGFALGAVLVAAIQAQSWDADLVSPAQAAQIAQGSAPADRDDMAGEFVSPPEGR